MTDPDNIPIFNMSTPQFASSPNSDINEVRSQFPMNNQHFEPCSSLDPSHSFTRPRISHNEHSIVLMNPPSRMNHPPSNNRTDIFFKTRLCTNFMFHSCRNGENCSYAHGKEELRQPPPNWQELDRQQKGGNRDTSKFLNEFFFKTRLCANFMFRSCRNGENCSYAHEKEELRQPPPNWHEHERQQLGGNRDTAKMCPKWKHTQSCPLGDDCNYAHGDAELQVPRGGIEAEAAAATANSTKAIIPTLRTTGFSAKYLSTLPASVPVATEEEKKAKKELFWNKKLNKINRIYGDWIDDLSPDCPDLLRES